MASSSFSSLKSLFANYQVGEDKGYISQEFQDYGYRLAIELDDLDHKSLYIKMAKNDDRRLVEQARSFVADADSARSKARLFMWKLKQLKDAKLKRENQGKKSRQGQGCSEKYQEKQSASSAR